jgi:hypothetical protein
MAGRDAKRIERSAHLPETQKKKPRRFFTQKQLDDAAEAISSNQMTYREAESRFRVPKSTLQRKVNSIQTKPIGRPYLLPEGVEVELAELVKRYCQVGNILEKDIFLTIARQFARCQDPPIEFQASENWLRGFLQRYDLTDYNDSKKKSLGIHRRIALIPEHISEFITKYALAFQDYSKALATHLNLGLDQLPLDELSAGIFAIDETSVSNRTPLKYEPRKIVSSGVTCLENKVAGRSTVSASMMEVYTANGSMPFHVITVGKLTNISFGTVSVDNC